MTPHSARQEPQRSRLRLLALILIASFLAGALTLRARYDYARTEAFTPPQIERRAAQHPRDIEAQLDWGDQLRIQERFPEAERVLRGAAALSPGDARPHIGLGMAALAQHQPARAESHFLHALERDCDNQDVLRGLAGLYERQSRIREAAGLYERLSRLAPRDAVVWRQLGLRLTQSREVFRGQQALEKAIALAPDDLLAQRYLGQNALSQGRLAQAQAVFERVLAADPGDAEALSVLAKIAPRLDSTPEGLALAAERIERAIATEPSAPRYVTRGSIALLQKRYAEAEAAFLSAMEHDPTLRVAQAGLAESRARANDRAVAQTAARPK